jgi:tetratricopeptide (TPR) repeat protein
MDRRVVPIVLVALGAGATAGLFVTLDDAPADAAPQVEVTTTTRPLRVRPSELARLDAQIEARSLLAEQRPGDWLSWQIIAGQYAERARLTGDLADYVHADESMARAFAAAPPGVGPFLARASLHATLHRFDRAAADLDAASAAAVVMDDDRAAIRALRAEVAFHTGDLATALRLYDEQLEAERVTSTLVPRAQYAWSTADFDLAESLLDEAREAARAEGIGALAWVCLARGRMERDRGRPEAALALYRACARDAPDDGRFPESIAAALFELGELDEAEAAYLDLATQPGAADAMDQLARIARARDDEPAFVTWRDRARAIHEERLAILPEAARGHALRHFLELEDDPTRALALAEQERALRPGGETLTLLALAHLRAGQVEQSRAIITALLDETPWSTAESHAISALAHETADPDRAARDRARAEALSPGAMTRLTWLTTP